MKMNNNVPERSNFAYVKGKSNMETHIDDILKVVQF